MFIGPAQTFAAIVAAHPPATALVPASQETLDKIQIVHEALRQVHDVDIATEHVLHGGMYARTIRLDAGLDEQGMPKAVVMVGSLIKLATMLIIHGPVALLAGDDRVDLDGYNVLPGCAGRKQLFVTKGPVEMTMIFPTQAKTVEDAENEVFADADQLMSRRDGSGDTITITGE